MDLMSNVLVTILLFLKKATYTLVDNDIFSWNLVSNKYLIQFMFEDAGGSRRVLKDWKPCLTFAGRWNSNIFILKYVFIFKLFYNYRHSSFNNITFAFPSSSIHIISILRQWCTLRTLVFNIVKSSKLFTIGIPIIIIRV